MKERYILFRSEGSCQKRKQRKLQKQAEKLPLLTIKFLTILLICRLKNVRVVARGTLTEEMPALAVLRINFVLYLLIKRGLSQASALFKWDLFHTFPQWLIAQEPASNAQS